MQCKKCNKTFKITDTDQRFYNKIEVSEPVYCPDCRMHSLARATAKTPRIFEHADNLVQACRDIIEYLQPPYFSIENPHTGYLKARPVVEGLPYVVVDYCAYGCLYRKRTRIWTNCKDWKPIA